MKEKHNLQNRRKSQLVAYNLMSHFEIEQKADSTYGKRRVGVLDNES